MQEVPLFATGPDAPWRGHTCPGAVLAQDPLVRFVSRTYLALTAWHQLPFPGDWASQPVWWVRATEVLHLAMLARDREDEPT